MIKKIIHLEYCLLFLGTFIIYMQSDFSLWVFFLLLLVPDISIVGYAINSKFGVILYNFSHSLVVPFILLGFATLLNTEALLITALIWIAHIFIDRAFGFGLKYADSFKTTHLQKL